MPRAAQAEQAGIPWLRRLAAPEPEPVRYIPYDIPLRLAPRAWAHVRVPTDFADADAERLCGVLRAIALPGSTRAEEDGGHA